MRATARSPPISPRPSGCRREAAQAEEAWREQINEAHAEGRPRPPRPRPRPTREAEKRVAKADAEIAAKTEAAAEALVDGAPARAGRIEALAAEAAREIVAKLTGAKVTDKAAQAAVTGALSRA